MRHRIGACQHTWFQHHGTRDRRFGKTHDRFALLQGLRANPSWRTSQPLGTLMEALLFSSGVVALAEIGDKTQLLALLLAARYRKPTPIIVGILIATLFNHAAAAGVGQWVTSHLGAETMRWLLGASFLGMAIWIMIPDKLDSDTRLFERLGIFGATFIAFFLAEMGDKTQIATVALAARFDSLISVVAGTTIGMLLANVPAVLFGDMVASRIPTRTVHTAAATLFAGLGVVTLLMPLSP